MTTSRIITCECGAAVRLPERPENRRFRCPNCRAGIALGVDAQVLTTTSPRAGDTGVICPICQSPLAAGEPAVTCPKCDQIHHRECWAEVGGCATYGCEQAPALQKGEASSPPLSAWGDTKRCPVCGETIKAIALRCRYCQTDFDTVSPLTLADLHVKTRRSEGRQALQKQVIGLFAVSLIGCLAPITAIVGMFMLLPRRTELAKAGPLYQVLGYSAVILSVVYSVLMVLFAVFGQ